MRYPKGQKEETRHRILKAAGTVFRRQGYQGAGVDAVMKEAGLTHGGFYSHFQNKEALFEEAVEDAIKRIRDGRIQRGRDLDGVAWIRAMVEFYLDQNHRQQVERGCPMPPLVSELGRAGDGPRGAFENGILNWCEDITEHLSHLPEDERDSAAMGIVAALVGGMSIARAFRDDRRAAEVFEACTRMIEIAFLKPPDPSEDPDNAPTDP